MKRCSERNGKPSSSTIDPTPPIILITGSSGFIGRPLVNALSGDFSVIGLDIVPPERNHGLADWIECDLTSDAGVRKAFSRIKQRYGHQFASVIHLAAHEDPSGAPSPLHEEVNVEGTHRLLRALREARTEQIVFTSSLVVARRRQDGRRRPIDPSTITAKTGHPYVRSKLAAEMVLRTERNGSPVVIHRLAPVYDDDCRSLPLAQLIHRVRQKRFKRRSASSRGSGAGFIHLDDAIHLIVCSIVRRYDLSPFEVLLLAESDLMSESEIQEALGEALHGKDWPAIRNTAAMPDTETEEVADTWSFDLGDEEYRAEIRRTERVLGCKTTKRLRETLKEIVSRLKRDPRRWQEINARAAEGEMDSDAAEQPGELLAG